MDKKFNMVWDTEVTPENNYDSFLVGKPQYSLFCDKCTEFIGKYDDPNDCKIIECPGCKQKLINDI